MEKTRLITPGQPHPDGNPVLEDQGRLPSRTYISSFVRSSFSSLIDQLILKARATKTFSLTYVKQQTDVAYTCKKNWL